MHKKKKKNKKKEKEAAQDKQEKKKKTKKKIQSMALNCVSGMDISDNSFVIVEWITVK